MTDRQSQGVAARLPQIALARIDRRQVERGLERVKPYLRVAREMLLHQIVEARPGGTAG